MKKSMNDLTKLLTKEELIVKNAAEIQKTILNVIEKSVFRTCPK